MMHTTDAAVLEGGHGNSSANKNAQTHKRGRYFVL